jgi:hypothetical protein
LVLVVVMTAGPMVPAASSSAATVTSHVGPTGVGRAFRAHLAGIKANIEVFAGGAVIGLGVRRVKLSFGYFVAAAVTAAEVTLPWLVTAGGSRSFFRATSSSSSVGAGVRLVTIREVWHAGPIAQLTWSPVGAAAASSRG